MPLLSRLTYDPTCPLDITAKPLTIAFSKHTRCGFSKVKPYSYDAIEMVCCSTDDAQLTVISSDPNTLQKDLQHMSWNTPQSPFPLDAEIAKQVAERVKTVFNFPDPDNWYGGGE